MSFNGSLLKFGNDDFPLNYVFKESYIVTPNRRQDLDSTRNANGILQRNVLSHTASTIDLTVRNLNNKELASLMSFIRSHYLNEQEKKLSITYYCPDLDDYKTGEFYVPDIEFTIRMIDTTNNAIEYSQFTLEFIEY